jgi:hypothetical protein
VRSKINRTPWFCQEIKEYKDSKTEEEYSIYKLVRNEVNFGIMKIKEDYWEAYTTNKLQRSFYGTQQQVWRMV